MEGDFDWDDPTLADAIDVGELYMSDERMSLIANHIVQNHKVKTRNEFCFYSTLHLSEKIKQAATGLIEGIDRKTVLSQDVYLPSIAVQKQIVMVLSRIDEMLFAQENFLEQLILAKKGLMQQLFI